MTFLVERDVRSLRCSCIRYSLASVAFYLRRAAGALEYELLYSHLQDEEDEDSE